MQHWFIEVSDNYGRIVYYQKRHSGASLWTTNLFMAKQFKTGKEALAFISKNLHKLACKVVNMNLKEEDNVCDAYDRAMKGV